MLPVLLTELGSGRGPRVGCWETGLGLVEGTLAVILFTKNTVWTILHGVKHTVALQAPPSLSSKSKS